MVNHRILTGVAIGLATAGIALAPAASATTGPAPGVKHTTNSQGKNAPTGTPPKGGWLKAVIDQIFHVR